MKSSVVCRVLWLGLILLLAGCADGDARRLEQLADEECLESPEFVCVTVTAPVDHFDASVSGTFDIRFAIHPASSGRAAGVLVTAVGGPGSSGLEVAEALTLAFDPSITERFDLVYFDPRGVGIDADFMCPETDESAVVWDLVVAESNWATIDAEFAGYMGSCVAEMARPDLLPYLGTRQAVEDLEMFRKLVGYGRMTIYGQSYGTRYAQVYAQAHPDSVERLIIDGTIDVALNDLETTADDIATHEAIVERALDRCAADSACLGDMGMSPQKAYELLMKRLRIEPESVRYQVEAGTWEEVELSTDDVVSIGRDATYSASLKMLFLRTIAASTRDDLVPMVRLITADPVSGSGSMFNPVVNCLDGAVPGETFDAERAAIDELFQLLPPEQRWRTLKMGICAYVPGDDPGVGPAEPFVGEGIPTLVVGSVDDPATPYSQSLSVFERLAQGHLLTVEGGEHVMFGKGEPCIDELVTGFIRGEGTPTESTCVVEQPAYELPLDSAESHSALAERIDDELLLSPELYAWDGVEELVVACPYGGQLTLASELATEITYELEGCGLASEVLVSGDGYWDLAEGRTVNKLTFAGSTCSYVYDFIWGRDWAYTEESC